MKKNQSVIFDVRDDIYAIEAEILRSHILSPYISPHFVLTEYLLYLLEGLNDLDARDALAANLSQVSDGELTVDAARQIANVISIRHYRHVLSNQAIIQFSQSWYHDSDVGNFMIFRNNLDRIDRTGDVFERNRLNRLQQEGIF